MRIISGEFGGRRFSPPKNLPVRPTTDQAKEALFNIFNNHFDFDQINVLDLFAGTGSLSFEFASRGVKTICCVDQNYQCCSFIKATAAQLNISLNVNKSDVFKWIENNKGRKFDLIFADPPYDLKNLKNIPDLIFSNDILSENGWFVLEHPKEYKFSNHPNFKEHRNYGNVNFSVFIVKPN